MPETRCPGEGAIEHFNWQLFGESRDFLVKSVYPSIKRQLFRSNHILLNNEPLNKWICVFLWKTTIIKIKRTIRLEGPLDIKRCLLEFNYSLSRVLRSESRPRP